MTVLELILKLDICVIESLGQNNLIACIAEIPEKVFYKELNQILLCTNPKAEFIKHLGPMGRVYGTAAEWLYERYTLDEIQEMTRHL